MYPKEVKDHPKHLVSIKDLFYFLKSKVSLIWHTYLSFKFSVGMFALKTAVYFQLDPTDYDGTDIDSNITHDWELILT